MASKATTKFVALYDPKTPSNVVLFAIPPAHAADQRRFVVYRGSSLPLDIKDGHEAYMPRSWSANEYELFHNFFGYERTDLAGAAARVSA